MGLPNITAAPIYEKERINMILFFAIILGIICLDQVSKWLAIIFLKGETPVMIIKGLLRFSYVENRGAAFGMLSDQRWVFLVISTLAIIGIIVYMIKWRPESKLACVGIAFIAGGGIGNMIDRTLLGYVVDFIDFYTIWQFVFNIADSFVCVGAGLLMFYLVCETIKEYKANKLKKEQENDQGE